MSSLTQFFNSIANNCRNHVMTPEELRSRKRVSDRCLLIKIAAVAGLVSSVALGIFTCFFFGPIVATLLVLTCTVTSIVCYDVYVVADNVKAVIDSCFEEMRLNMISHERDQVNYLLRKTILTGLIFRMVSN
ncbi:MAG: hypothetical protein VX777_06565 [Chlamydiota bacterium]|nr:hypothetical protein [Chlamydiota bacterium]